MENIVKNLMFDLATGKDIYDEEQGRSISKAEANAKIRQICFEKLGLNEKSTARDIARALRRDAANELFEVIEEIVDLMVTTGWENNEFFNNFVETKIIADGDKNEFYTEQDIILTVAKVSGSHHDIKYSSVRVA